MSANVVRLTVEAETEPVRPAQQIADVHDFDDWGRHPDHVRTARRLAGVRWRVAVGGLDHLRSVKSALIVCNARPLALSPVMVALELSERLARTVRFVGVAETAPFGTVLRRAGGILHHPEEVATALRGGDHVVLGAQSGHRPVLASTLHAGRITAPFAAMAAMHRTVVVPAAVVSSPFNRSARLEFGEPLRAPRRRSAVLAASHLADAVQAATQRLLDETTPPGLTTLTSRGLL